MDEILKVRDLILSSKKTFALTGAGISTESGIPDFRSSTGYYSKLDPMLALSRDILINNPKRFYKEGYVILEDLSEKKPNRGHIVLAELENMGLLNGVITQNIDNLHRKAGSKNIYEVHGETGRVHCISCNENYPFKVMKEKVMSGEIPPHCDKCGGVIRPNVVMFGDMMPGDFEMAVEELMDTELLIVIGSSLTVSPVNYLPRYVKKLVIINDTPTLQDKMAEVVVRGKSGEILSQILDEVKKLR
ncbi:NAD-dependent protein deacylase [Peptoniphilus sp. oral taxon 386]|uniref:SIR2 family NAD-dependent protein deacylase n=1 Tax=Peptoniphilus sp. oral taxon 386 TaxID=652713 RepID=UPI0001DAA41D|nr:NAD-dependent protein deacylase [Peptoniphilus sp. oral taxon 386]EFI41323.1 NAD-dependent deacetylase [Peptoniphilus sp. oral taxon 386 str. F0131]